MNDDHIFHPLTTGHLDVTTTMLALEAASAPLVILSGEPGLGKSYHFESIAAREAREESLYRIQPTVIAYSGMGAINMTRYSPMYAPTDENKGLPEWQKRRNQSRAAKAALIAKMRKGS